MQKPTLIVMAAGMGSRYGGLKQMDPVGVHGEIIIDYSLYDAMQAGFERVVFIINRRIERDFDEAIGRRARKYLETHYAFQELDSMLPAGFSTPDGREKPWGTAHALLCCKDLVNGPFAAINADDFYGRRAFTVMYDYLTAATDAERYDWSMVGYMTENTLTDNGSVARGICRVDASGRLVDIVERLSVVKTPDGPAYTDDGGKSYTAIPAGNLVSMNFFGFTPSLFTELERRFSEFLFGELPANPLKGEFLIPLEVGRLLRADKAAVTVLSSQDRWYGVTYREDKPGVAQALADMTARGLYPHTKLLA